MASTKFSDLIPDVLTVMSADPSDPVTEHAIRRAAITFCRDSWVWKEVSDPIDVISGTAVYDLEPPTGADVARVVTAILDGRELVPSSIDTTEFSAAGSGHPKLWAQVDTEQIILAPNPDSTISAGLIVTLALQPTQTAANLPRWIATHHRDTIINGAVAFLLGMPGQTWTDFNLASAKDYAFRSGISDARASAVAGLSRASLRTTSYH